MAGPGGDSCSSTWASQVSMKVTPSSPSSSSNRGRDGLSLAADHSRVQPPSQGQQLTEQCRGEPVGDQPSEAGLQVGQLRVVRSGNSSARGWNVRRG